MYDKKQREVYRSLAGAKVDEIKGTVSSIRFSNEKMDIPCVIYEPRITPVLLW